MSSSDLPQQIVEVLKSVIQTDAFIPLHEPCFQGNEWDYVKECIDTGWVSSVGKYVDWFEEKIAEYTGIPHAIATVNGTAALHICLLLAGVKPQDEVLIPALTFVATANAVSYTGAIPHLVDSTEKTLGIDPFKLDLYLKEISTIKNGECVNRKTGRRIHAVVPMHTFGHPVEIDELVDVCQRYHLILIEDAAESLGSFYKGSHTGAWGLVSALSFNGNKILTTGGGGIILTKDSNIAKLAKHLTTTAKKPHPWEYSHDYIGYNYRLPNINAALGCAQLEQLPQFLAKKRVLAEQYRQAFERLSHSLKFFIEPEDSNSNYWLNAILLNKEIAHLRDAVLEYTNAMSLMTRPAWTLMNRLPMFQNCPHMDLSIAESLECRIINIPSSSHLISEVV